MSDFTDEDRATQIKTLTLLESHVKLSDERHGEVKAGLADHETRLRKNEGILGKVAVVSSFFTFCVTALIAAFIRKST